MSARAGMVARLRGTPAERVPVRVIEANTGSAIERIVDAWRYRHLAHFFAKRLLEKRYRRTALGWIWLPLRPTLDVSMRAFLFGGLLGVSAGPVPYIVFLLIAMSSWHLFDRTAFWGMRALEVNRGVLNRVYVPRLVPLVSSIAPGFVEFAIYGVIVLIALVYYKLANGIFYLRLDYGPLQAAVGVLLLVALALSLALWLSVMAARTRDVRFVMRYVFSIWMYITPVLYPLDSLHGIYRTAALINPVTAPLEMIKSGLIHNGVYHPLNVLVTVASIFVLGISGFWFFNRAEANALDRL
jgi:lipopolysaccharide transport system permease protein